MKNLAIILSLTLLTGALKAQKAVTFRYKYLPDYTYASNMKTNMDMAMNMKTDSATAAKDVAGGQNQSMAMIMNMGITADIKTGALKTDKTMPFSITYKNMDMVATMNGKELPLPKAAIEGKKLTGTCDVDGKMHIDTISTTGDQQLNATMKDAFNKMQNVIKFPDKPLAIGESFTQEIPMNFPAGPFKMDFATKTTYTLTAIKDNMAYFDTKLVMNIDMKTAQSGNSKNMTGDGDGAGKMVFDIKRNFPASMDSDMNINFNMDMGQAKMMMKLKGKSTISYVVSPNK
jgi:hypothetical protein